MDRARCLALVVATVLLCGAVPAPEPKKATAPAPAKSPSISGTVKGADGKPIAGATVQVRERRPERARWSQRPAPPVSLTTDEAGRFTAPDLTAASYRVRVQARGHAPTDLAEVTPGAVLTIALKAGHAIEGRVLEAASREPIEGITVLALDQGSRAIGEAAAPRATTGADGRFRIADLPAGVVDLEARGAAWARGLRPGITVPRPARAPVLEFFLQPGGRVAGRVIGADGAPVEGASVSIRTATMSIGRAIADDREPLVTAADGRFAFDGVPAGTTVQVSAAKKGASRAESGPLTIEAGRAREDVELRLQGASTLAVRVLDPEGEPVRALQVELRTARAAGGAGTLVPREYGEDEVRSEGEGRFTLPGLDAGTTTVVLLPDGLAEIEREGVRLRAGETTDLGTVRATGARLVRGRVSDAEGKPIAGADVEGSWLADQKFRSRRTKTDAEGRFRLPGPAEGPLQSLRVSAKGYASADRERVFADQGDVDLVLARAGRIVGKVVLADGVTPAAAQLSAHRHSEGEQTPGRMRMVFGQGRGDNLTDAAGAFAIEDVEPGVYTVEAMATGLAPARATDVRVEAEGVADAGTLRLHEGLSLKGRVLDVKDDTPIAGASVFVEEQRTFRGWGGTPLGRASMSDGAGAFEIGGLEARSYQLVVEHPSFARADTRIELHEGTDRPEQVVRLSRGGTLTGTVRGPGGQPVPQAMVVIVQGMGGNPQTATTGPDGTYRVERLAPGSYRAVRSPDDGRIMIGMNMKSFTISEGETTVLDFDEAARITLAGRVLRGGTPVPSATLVFFAGDLGQGAPAMTDMKTASSDADGRYQIGLDKPGPYTVMVQQQTGEVFGRSSVSITVPDETQVAQDLILSVAGIAGVVRDPDGQPVSGAILYARPEGDTSGGVKGAGGQSTPEGTYAIDGLEPGRYVVSASATGYRVVEARVEVGSDVARLDLRLERGAVMRGRVVDANGQPLAGALVFTAPASSPEMVLTMPAQTDVNGSFQLTTPSDGPVDVTAIAAGWAPARLSGIVVQPGDEGSEILLRATAGGRLRVRVAKADGSPAAGTPILTRAVPPFVGSAMIAMQGTPTTGPDGLATIDLLSPGTYEVSVPGRQDVAPVTAQVTEGAETAMALALP